MIGPHANTRSLSSVTIHTPEVVSHNCGVLVLVAFYHGIRDPEWTQRDRLLIKFKFNIEKMELELEPLGSQLNLSNILLYSVLCLLAAVLLKYKAPTRFPGVKKQMNFIFPPCGNISYFLTQIYYFLSLK